MFLFYLYITLGVTMEYSSEILEFEEESKEKSIFKFYYLFVPFLSLYFFRVIWVVIYNEPSYVLNLYLTLDDIFASFIILFLAIFLYQSIWKSILWGGIIAFTFSYIFLLITYFSGLVTNLPKAYIGIVYGMPSSLNSLIALLIKYLFTASLSVFLVNHLIVESKKEKEIISKAYDISWVKSKKSKN